MTHKRMSTWENSNIKINVDRASAVVAGRGVCAPRDEWITGGHLASVRLGLRRRYSRRFAQHEDAAEGAALARLGMAPQASIVAPSP
jgi:hypothetical protein